MKPKQAKNRRSERGTSKSFKSKAKKSKPAKSEGALIADQLRRAFDGSAWHGPALLELLGDVDAATAAAKPFDDVHSIWELVLHIEAWDEAASVRLAGHISQPTGEDNFPPVCEATDAAWLETIHAAKRTHAALIKTVTALPNSRLRDRVPGKRYDFYHMLHGIVQHELYHAGQIALLKKAGTGSRGQVIAS
jgi:uncharacterized damage-inducible protein DinB